MKIFGHILLVPNAPLGMRIQVPPIPAYLFGAYIFIALIGAFTLDKLILFLKSKLKS